MSSGVPLVFTGCDCLRGGRVRPRVSHCRIICRNSVSVSRSIGQRLRSLCMGFGVSRPSSFHNRDVSIDSVMTLGMINRMSFRCMSSIKFRGLRGFVGSRGCLGGTRVTVRSSCKVVSNVVGGKGTSKLRRQPSILRRLGRGPIPSISRGPPGDRPRERVR